MARRITIASYNIHAGVGNDGQFRPERTAAVIDELDAAVVALQEVEYRPVGQRDLLGYLGQAANMRAIAGPTLERDHGLYGNALLTRLPVLKLNRVDLSVPGREPRGALDVTLDWGGRELQVVATHLGLRPRERRHQIRRILKLFDQRRPECAVLMGDLNEWFHYGRPLRWLRRRFTSPPKMRTYPSARPVFALDQIWVTPAHKLHTMTTHGSAMARLASDHLPVQATLQP